MWDSFYAAQMEATAVAWKAPYIGDRHHAFLATIQEMKREARGADYKNIIPIIQSSGAGKSRLAHEVASLVFTLPLNLRPPEERSAYPPTDVAPRLYLVPFSPHRSPPQKMRLLQLTFFVAMFDVAAEYVRTLSPGKVYEDEAALAADWREFLDRDDARSRHEFYDRVTEEAEKRVPLTMWNAKPRERDTLLYKLRDEARRKGVKTLTDAITSRLRGEPRNADVLIFVYIDEVYNLSTMPCTDEPSTTLYDTLLDAFNYVGPANPIFLATIATSPTILRPVDRLLQHQPPWTSFVWDYLPDRRPIFKRGEMTLQDVAQPSFMAKFGRPLFWTRWNAADKMRLYEVKTSIRAFAFAKLTLHRDTSEFDEAHRWGQLYSASRLAPICTRVSVDFLSSTHAARAVEERMVAANMRSLAGVPVENDYIESRTPSEPLLADAAARVMSESTYSPAGELARCADEGWLKHGPALAARLLLIVTYDRAVRKTHGGRPFHEWGFSAAVPLLAFLQQLCADRWHDVLRGAQAAGAARPLQDAFAGAFVRFSHFIVFDGAQELDVRAALAGVARGFACRVEPPQPGVDIAVPVVMRDAKLDLDVMSFLLIQIVPRGTAPRRPSPAALAKLFPPSATEAHPVIHLAMQLEPGMHAPAPEPADETPTVHACYRLTAYGCSPSVYKAVDGTNAAAYAKVARPHTLASEHLRQHPDHLRIVESLKGEWERGPGSYGWTDVAELNKPADGESAGHVEGLWAV